jgi:hypothetical protein
MAIAEINRGEEMQSRRFAYWWLRMLLSGRFVEKFFNWRESRRDAKKDAAN